VSLHARVDFGAPTTSCGRSGGAETHSGRRLRRLFKPDAHPHHQPRPHSIILRQELTNVRCPRERRSAAIKPVKERTAM
jgi:hypothetical protein